jgi:hypothetical protein
MQKPTESHEPLSQGKTWPLHPQPYSRVFQSPLRQTNRAQEFSRPEPLATHSRSKASSPQPQVPAGQQTVLLQYPESQSLF